MLDIELLLILFPAFIAGIIILSTHVVLGRQVLKRGIIFIDLAIAQVAALGAIVAHMDHRIEDIPYSHVWMPAIFALGGAGLIAWLSKRFADELEAFIGCFYVLSAVGAMLLLSNDPHGAELLKQLMSGQILWVNWSQLVLPALVSVAILALIALKPQILEGAGFYFLFAIVITLSVELVGVYLVFSTLILPALALNQYVGKYTLLLAYVVGFVGYLAGLILSASYDLPSGAAIVAALAVSAVLMRLLLSNRSNKAEM
ncbi:MULTISPECIES: metal ABC transporter permease [unclassified Shewanella]|uniref:metal ABC transporter permease n=1 Tax=unclassified Shewanella TaxID=196818 RepID=UPI000C84A40A|nr:MULTISPECIES: metal ABC transporter permease [unclassified Shewanella]MDO6679537.1 metal ABC transporter permease [Shewanella sp. 4_MG-2023]MDO6774619.1 metal ABC transporter permease [Shewanella sp. 3_MG-2023]PMG32275.1 ABC transporter [Shewanella sp. 10N.286.52.C2]PMG45255.1 ABC transporter [Shewanella sp. 10N.286.52.B9]PMH88277.1 ABC transporter [Shewanella sp. 10N.286.48.B5]